MPERPDITPHDRASRSRAVSVVTLGPAVRFVLRMAPALAPAVRQAGGFDLTGRINSAIAAGDLSSVRLGPDEWLLIGPDGQSEALASDIASALAGRFHSLVDISHRNAAIAVAGPTAGVVLNAGVPIDLDDATFPPGSATRTLLGKAEIVLIRAGAASAYRVECSRSFAPYVRAFLEEAARASAAG